MGSPAGSVVKNPACNAGDMEDVSSIPGLGRSPGERIGNQLQYSCLGNPMDRRAWRGVAKGSDLTSLVVQTVKNPFLFFFKEFFCS